MSNNFHFNDYRNIIWNQSMLENWRRPITTSELWTQSKYMLSVSSAGTCASKSDSRVWFWLCNFLDQQSLAPCWKQKPQPKANYCWYSSGNHPSAVILFIQLLYNLNKMKNVLFIRSWRADYWTCSGLEQEKDMCHGHSSREKIYKGTLINDLIEQIPYCPMWS